VIYILLSFACRLLFFDTISCSIRHLHNVNTSGSGGPELDSREQSKCHHKLNTVEKRDPEEYRQMTLKEMLPSFFVTECS
jgi:hypothetical protein